MNHPSLLQLQWQGVLQDYITVLACSPIEHSWAAASAAGEVVVWQDEDLQPYRVADQLSIDGLGYSADGQWLAAGGQGGLSLWRQGVLQPQSALTINWVERLAWHPQLPWLAVSGGHHLQIWDANSQEIILALKLPNSIFDLAWHPQGQSLATAGYRGVTVRQTQDWEAVELLGVDTGAHRLAWSGDGQYLAAATLDRQLTIAETSALEAHWIMKGFPSKIQQLTWLPNQPLLAVISGGQVVWWLYTNGQWQSLTEAEPAQPILALAAHPQVPLVAKVAAGGAMSLQDLDFILLEQQEVNWTQSTTMQWHPQGQDLIIGSTNGDLARWTLAN